MTNQMVSARQTAELDIDKIRADFPILSRQVNGKPLVYLDSAASAQKPNQVIEALVSAYQDTYSNVHRGLHFLSEASTDAYEAVRGKVAGFIGAASGDEIVLTAGATMSLNLIAQSWAAPRLQAGDEILISIAEHHANIVPWQMVAEKTGAVVRAFPMEDDGSFRMGALTDMITAKTRIIAIPHVSNVLGTVFPVADIAKHARSAGSLLVVDGCQGVVHMPVDVQALGADFYVFSGHKLYGPNGVGVLWGRGDILADMPPFLGGGDMIKEVTIEATTYNDLPHKFEAGTPHIEGGLGLGAAIDWVNRIDIERIAAQEAVLLDAGTQMLQEVDGLRMIGTAADKAAVCSFVIDGVHPHDLGTLLDQSGVAIRTGHHCAQPVMKRFGVPATARASFAGYNSLEEIEIFRVALEKALRLLR